MSFPYEFKEVKPEELKLLKNVYKVPYRFGRLGPSGTIVTAAYMKDAANIYNMPLRPTDVFVASYQRSGTTWTQELVWLLANDLDYTTAANVPLVHRYPFIDIFMSIDTEQVDEIVKCICDSSMNAEKIRQYVNIMGQPVTGMVAAMPASKPRFIKTHVPMSLLNPKLLDTAKMVYVARDPRDVAVSCFHHAKLFKLMQFPGGFKEFWNLFHRDLYLFCPIFAHVKEAWEQRNNPNMLFLFYEELSKDLPASIRRVADFLGKSLNQEQMDRLCDHLSIESFKKNKSINFEEMKELGLLAKDESFIRKGKAGGWRDYFDEEMTQQAEQWIADNLRDTDLRYPSVNK
ncbi:luciferin sulfotransferase-like [Anticarsia gemmatalis]|uniref:luciferin sulfotransferase-like n=1 Tax=Anticarsia gemmatalis TaxID=129554 RepID=UPI003F775CC3